MIPIKSHRILNHVYSEVNVFKKLIIFISSPGYASVKLTFCFLFLLWWWFFVCLFVCWYRLDCSVLQTGKIILEGSKSGRASRKKVCIEIG